MEMPDASLIMVGIRQALSIRFVSNGHKEIRSNRHVVSIVSRKFMRKFVANTARFVGVCYSSRRCRERRCVVHEEAV